MAHRRYGVSLFALAPPISIPISDDVPPSAQVFSVLICMFVIITKIDVDWGEAFLGYLPSGKVFQAGGLYTCESPGSTFGTVDAECFLF